MSEKPSPDNGNYELFVREDDNAVDSLDWVKLITIDHEPGGELVLSRGGSLYDVLLSVPPTSAVDDRGVDVLHELSYRDGVTYSREDSGWVELTYSGLDTMRLVLDSTASGTVPGGTEKMPTGMVAERPRPNILTVSVLDSVGSWRRVERIFSRSRPRPTFVDLSKYFSPIVRVRYSWSVRYEVDYLGYNWVKQITNGIDILSPTSAMLNDSLDVRNNLKRPDNQFAGFFSGEYIRLKFPFNAIPENKERDFVFLCRGKYDNSDSLAPPRLGTEPSLPRELALGQNYPNPFNSTTVIQFANPQNQYISIKVYNILGQQVATLLSEEVKAGYHQIVWDGKNAEGNSISSGIYFYRLSAEDRTIRRKLLLLK